MRGVAGRLGRGGLQDKTKVWVEPRKEGWAHRQGDDPALFLVSGGA